MNKILPNFIIAGVARCGTTSLYYYLKQHPQIGFSSIKEPKFFSSFNQLFPHKGPGDLSIDKKVIKNFDEYCKLFTHLKKNQCVGEASSDYFYFHKNTIPLLKRYLGEDLKIIICLRNPIERSFSAYNNLIRDSRETNEFFTSLSKEEFRIKSNYDWMWHYSNGSLYSEGIKAFKNSFKKVKIILNEDLKNNPKTTLIDIFNFLGVDDSFKADFSKKYSKSGKPKNFFFKIISDRTGIFYFLRNFIIKNFPRSFLEVISKNMFKKGQMDSKSKIYLKNFFKDDILETEKQINRDLSAWK